ncbi:hypothetical protein [Lactiplantibacillus paraplantarum]|uniref:Uncharacterized protein n=1 Tax=Lactiplantibacillus paraplantarum TaxID=60520 RepID=A0AAD0X744_9LACO|nr:hypothetical protein [Lactiplantibacillus paraplantarum]AVW09257.1 hypothetical protein DA077_01265 [Lactiplantibacillus paraplantarum]AYJ37524.1 hypothetical protein LP667_01170 [Lactiplantibacillus paraplantarum]ERL45301.1 hypothetical protein N644_0762 [Lactiplantibacillus paraplantarum]KRL51244.1 hypothetical protein FD48_GL001525 [Lactiplantibacillus paraplantarum DSM 10667]MCU4682479.1 hypothetical protein [Lactiplantibacillus paraplantarum]
MSQLTKAITRQLQRQYAEPVLKDLNGNWYTGADMLEDLALCETSLQQQNVHAGQAILLSPAQVVTIPSLLLASWQLGLTVTLTPPSHQLPEIAPQVYAAMVYSSSQTNQLANQLDPSEISVLTLILNTAPNFAYLVHDHAQPLARHSHPDLILPANQCQFTQSQLLKMAEHDQPRECVHDLYDLETGLLPCLTNLITATPFTIQPTKTAFLPN